MAKLLVQQFNEVVQPEDTTYFLGDLAMGNRRVTLDGFKQLNGRKIAVPGNHDKVFPGNGKWREHLYDFMSLGGFDEVLPSTAQWQPAIMVDNVPVLLSHLPYPHAGGSHGATDDRYEALRPRDHGMWLLCGHVHDFWKQRGRQINVGTDVWGYYPVSEHTIAEMMSIGPIDRENKSREIGDEHLQAPEEETVATDNR